MRTKKTFTKELIVMTQEKLFEEFQKTCESNYKTMSEVVRDMMLKYIRENKNIEK